jgi:Family of unknown function (DUF6680)
MTKSEWLMVLAILLAPLVAIQVQKYIELITEKYQRKGNIFYTLMATRGRKLDPEHVKALNKIDIDFYGWKIFGFRYQSKSEKEVQSAWKIYLSHLSTPIDLYQVPDEERKAWDDRSNELFTELLYNIAQSLRYKFNKDYIRTLSYIPRIYGEIEQETLLIRRAILEVLSGRMPIPMNVVHFPVSEEGIERQNTFNSLLIECLEGKRTIKVSVENKGDKESKEIS